MIYQTQLAYHFKWRTATLGTDFSPRMDEPTSRCQTPYVDMNSWEVSACWFLEWPFICWASALPFQNHRSLWPASHLCSSNCHSQNVASLCHCTNHTMSKPCLAHLRASVTLGRRLPQSNYPPGTSSVIQIQDHQNIKNYKGGISRTTPPHLATRLQSLPPILHMREVCQLLQCQAVVKVHGVFPSSRGYTASSAISTSLSLAETAWPSLRHSCRSELTWTRNSRAQLGPAQKKRPPFTGVWSKSFQFPKQSHQLTFRHRAGVTSCIMSSYDFAWKAVFLINSCSHLVSATLVCSIRMDFTDKSVPLLQLRYHFGLVPSPEFSQALMVFSYPTTCVSVWGTIPHN